ncbi:fungal-specific transcription factor domain-containing protein [Trametes gibbosa]|uniref:Zn(2)-Cys(6)25 n=1 Tax=Trametes gibbosa TaxID=160864 RepID=A0A976XHI9_9APHY|nr:fungal-specific transcription factor domain-containing protein [Trametes gibbosa]UVB64069.1 Zn(2)-Cys(6)25 [Trametes gibbosa]
MDDDLAHQPSYSLSEEDGNEPGPSTNAPNIKRGTRACDRCRKIKSKCELGLGERCKNCDASNTPCTFQGPSFKRGPPKGYIHSIEQRWHQVECILATIMESPRAQDIILDLRGDPFANSILDRVQTGPYGAKSRLHQPVDTNSESFYASLVEAPDHSATRDDRRSRRQSRVSREIVSQDPAALTTPTKEWQEQLARRLVRRNQWTHPPAAMSPAPQSSSPTAGLSDLSRSRRRLDYTVQPNPMPVPQNWDNLYTLPASPAEPSTMDETAESFGHLSTDENKEFRYHGSASGLPLLAQSRRKTDDHLQEDRIWKFSQSEINPETSSQDPILAEEDVAVDMPSAELQTHLLHLYFTYVHPFFPVIHKQDFLYHYNHFHESVSVTVDQDNGPHRHPMQRPCKLLLLAMFAIAARYLDRPADRPGTGIRHSLHMGQQYANDAHKLLARKYQTSRPSTCQALLLLAIREFGMGAMDKGWLYSGMALRMAIDVGMNRTTDSWTTDGKTPVFTSAEKQIRKHIWWSCCICDKLSAVWLGRPITFRANDYSISLPVEDEVDELELWQPYPRDSLGSDFIPQPSRLMTCFREACHLSVIITDIMDKIYPVQPSSEIPRRVLFEGLEARLSKWLIVLPEHLRYSYNDKHTNPNPHVMMLHIEYEAAVLLLHRAFLPSYDEGPHSNRQLDTLASKAFDVCSSSAVHISSMAKIYDETFGLKKAPPFLSIYLQSAGIMHVITLTRRPWDPQATIGLAACITACEHMEELWPTATRLRLLLQGDKVRLDKSTYTTDSAQGSGRKRSVEVALGSSQNPDIAGHEAYTVPPTEHYSSPNPQPSTSHAWDYAQHARSVAQSLGVHMPSHGPSPSVYPGYQWWPTELITTEGLTHMALSAPMDMPPVSAPMVYSTMPIHRPHPGQGTPAQETFTFDQSQLSQDFVQGVQGGPGVPGVDYPAYQYGYPHIGGPGQNPPHQ